MTNQSLQALEHQIDQLVYHCGQLEKDNQALLSKQSSWHKERGKLIEKNDVARTRVEAMIERLRALEAQA